MGIENKILCECAQGGLGFPWAAVIPAIITAAGGVTAAAIAARTAKKNNQAAKELAQMQFDQQQKMAATMPSMFTTQTQTQTTAAKQDNTMLWLIAGLGLTMLLMRR